MTKLGHRAGGRQPGGPARLRGHSRPETLQPRPARCRDGSPGSQSVAEKFAVSWPTVLVSSHGAVVLRCDGRGSGFQGTRLLHEVRRRLGVLEERDQLEAVR